jgi:hypothetical protein
MRSRPKQGRPRWRRYHPPGRCVQAGLGDRSRFKFGTDEAGAMRAFSLDHAWIQRVDADLFRAEFAGEHTGDGVDRALCAGVNRTAWLYWPSLMRLGNHHTGKGLVFAGSLNSLTASAAAIKVLISSSLADIGSAKSSLRTSPFNR